ncbi:MAG: PDR/VanB family oxidoreductase [Rhodospirillales bacterium]
MEEPAQMMDVRVTKRTKLTPVIDEFRLAPVDGGTLPGFEPGSHITVATPSGAMRRYSLVNDGTNPTEYVLAIKREPESRGGSSSMHEQAVEGAIISVQAPDNEFKLVDGEQYILIAGGIGVTPILAMANKLTKLGKPFELFYVSRSATDAAYLQEMSAFKKATIHHDEGDPEKVFDFWDRLEKPKKEHIYCCGPQGLMNEIRALTGHWPESQVHFEDFNPVVVIRPDDVAFKVTLANDGKTYDVPADRSILEALRDAGVPTVSSCETGTCGTCRCRVIEGEVEHRDVVLEDSEKERGDTIMICVSRANGGDLVIEI